LGALVEVDGFFGQDALVCGIDILLQPKAAAEAAAGLSWRSLAVDLGGQLLQHIALSGRKHWYVAFTYTSSQKQQPKAATAAARQADVDRM
jgi:hypothetical protein